MELNKISDDDLLVRIKALCGQERQVLARTIGYLAQVEERQIHLKLACSSMFDFCMRLLDMSESQAFQRIAAARLLRRFPSLLRRIERGEIHLATLMLLRKHLTDENHEELLSAASRRSKRSVQRLIATRFPRPDVPSMIRKLPDRAVAATSPPEPTQKQPLLIDRPARTDLLTQSSADQTEQPMHPSQRAEPMPAPKVVRPKANANVEPLSAERHKLQMTISTELRNKLERAIQLMRHANPSGDFAVVVERALDLLLAKLEKAKLGKAARPLTRTRAAKPDRVTQSVRRAAYERDGEQCSYLDHQGVRCTSAAFLEIEHIHPQALGGTSEEGNIQILCRAHNQLRAEEAFGREYIAWKTRQRRAKSASATGTASTTAAIGIVADPLTTRSTPDSFSSSP